MSEHAVLEAELPLETIGARLLRAREASGMSRTQLAAMTKIPERHLAAIEASDFGALPARTYAVGFSRSYAKALGLNEAEVVDAVRTELAHMQPSPLRAVPAFEPGDPARVPAARLAWLAALAALVVVIAGIAFAWRSYYAPGGTLPSILPEEAAAPASSVPAPAAPTPTPAPVAGPVVFTAMAPAVWVKFTDAAGKQIMQKELAQGETFTVPQDQADVKIWTAHPESLAITIGGQSVPRLAEQQRTVKDISVTAAALLARAAASTSPGPTSAPVQSRPMPSATPRRRAQPGPRDAASGPAPDAAAAASPTAGAPAPASPTVSAT